MNFKGQNIVSIRDFSRDDIEHILDVSRTMVPIAKGKETSDLLKGKILATLFFEPSTRTNLSFKAAMLRLGGSTLGFTDVKSTSAKKGETLADTIRMAEAYSDIIVLRHPQEGAARLASQFSSQPIINAGDGAGQHPTQTLLDLFTINEEVGSIEGKNIALVGDLRYGRTAHSLSHALAMFNANLTFLSPKTLTMPTAVIRLLEQEGANIKVATTLEEVAEESDIIYMTRIQKERFPDPSEYKKVAGSYMLDPEMLEYAKKTMRIMHPLPRVDEIPSEIDSSEHAAYFRQAFNGVPVRMALLALVSGVVK
ncbi:MAG: aspartate carbamoyltransferase [Thermoplasmata archaeon]|nr:aspartate carbamoyltransferase [Thermoplasmata archaeon]